MGDDGSRLRNRRNPSAQRRESDRQMYEMAVQANSTAAMAIGKIEQHEAVCTERYGHTKDSLRKLEDVPAKMQGLHDQQESTKEALGALQNVPLAITELKGQTQLMLKVVGWGTAALITSMGGMAWAFFWYAFKSGSP